MMVDPADPRDRPIDWRRTGDGEVPYDAELDGRRWAIRINDFPAEPMYTLIVDGDEALTFDEWPVRWIKP